MGPQTLRTTSRKQTEKQGKIEFKLNGELVMGRRQKGDEIECQFRPLCPEAIVQTELLAIHVRYNHINIEETMGPNARDHEMDSSILVLNLWSFHIFDDR